MDKKLAIIMSGGGMTCCYSAGFLSALVKEYKLTEPDIIIASSGSSGSAAYYVANQYESMTNLWGNELSTIKFINYLRFWRIIDIDYLVDVVMKKIEPLNTEAIKSSDINLIIPAIDADNGTVTYFNNKDQTDIFEDLRATKAMPILFNKKVKINENRYCDSRLISSTDFGIKKALELGATHIVVVATNKYTHNKLYLLGYELWVKSRGKRFCQNYNELQKSLENLKVDKNTKILHIEPSSLIPITTLGNEQELLRETIHLGYSDCKENTSLKALIKDYLS